MSTLFLALQDVTIAPDQFFQEMNGAPAEIGTNEMTVAFWTAFLLLVSVVLAISFVVSIIVTWLIYRPYRQLPSSHQTLSPWIIWLLLVPLVNLVIMFLVAIKVPDSFRNYFQQLGNQSFGDCGKTFGLVWAIATVACLVPLLNYIAGIVSLVCMILFIVKLWTMAGNLKEKPAKAVVKISLPENAV